MKNGHCFYSTFFAGNVMTDGIWGWAYSLGTFRKRSWRLAPDATLRLWLPKTWQVRIFGGTNEWVWNRGPSKRMVSDHAKTTAFVGPKWYSNLHPFFQFFPMEMQHLVPALQGPFPEAPPKKAGQSHNFSMVAWIPVPLSSTSFSTWFNGNFRILWYGVLYHIRPCFVGIFPEI